RGEFVVIYPSRRMLSTQARLFLDRFEAEVAHIHGIWEQAIGGRRRLARRAPGRARKRASGETGGSVTETPTHPTAPTKKQWKHTRAPRAAPPPRERTTP